MCEHSSVHNQREDNDDDDDDVSGTHSSSCIQYCA